MSGASAVEVGLVAAGATIVGAVASYLGTLYQSRSQRRQAREERMEIRAEERRKARRDTYLQFLDQVRVAEKGMDALWAQVREGDSRPASGAARQEIDKLESLATLVILEGPESAGVAARSEVLGVLQEEFVAALGVVNNSENPGGAHPEAPVIQMDFVPKRETAKNEFITVVKQVLGSDLDPLASDGGNSNRALDPTRATVPGKTGPAVGPDGG